jgi:hypothetical protein
VAVEKVSIGSVIHDDDHRALEALCTSVPIELAAVIANKLAVKMAWDTITTQRIGGDHVR